MHENELDGGFSVAEFQPRGRLMFARHFYPRYEYTSARLSIFHAYIFPFFFCASRYVIWYIVIRFDEFIYDFRARSCFYLLNNLSIKMRPTLARRSVL